MGRYTCIKYRYLCQLEMQDIVTSTFINAFESSPVHYLKPWPWWNQCRPAKKGEAAILWAEVSQPGVGTINLTIPAINICQYNIPLLLHVCLCDIIIDPLNQWSLNVLLISWWRMSGDKSSLMSALGKSLVKGCGMRYVNECQRDRDAWRTRMYNNIPNNTVCIP